MDVTQYYVYCMCVWNKRCLPAVSPHDLQDKRPLVAIKKQTEIMSKTNKKRAFMLKLSGLI